MTNAHLRPEFLLVGSQCRSSHGTHMIAASTTLDQVTLELINDVVPYSLDGNWIRHVAGPEYVHIEAYMKSCTIVYGDSYADCIQKLYADPSWQAAQEPVAINVSHEPMSPAARDSIREMTSHALGPGRSIPLVDD